METHAHQDCCQAEQKEVKAKITIEIAGQPSKVIEVDDFCVLALSDNKFGMMGRTPASPNLLDFAFWRWKVGDVLDYLLMERKSIQQGRSPGGIIVPK